MGAISKSVQQEFLLLLLEIFDSSRRYTLVGLNLQNSITCFYISSRLFQKFLVDYFSCAKIFPLSIQITIADNLNRMFKSEKQKPIYPIFYLLRTKAYFSSVERGKTKSVFFILKQKTRVSHTRTDSRLICLEFKRFSKLTD